MDEQTTNFWKDRSVFVTGATGIIGTQVMKRLLDRGANVLTLVRDHAPLSLATESGGFIDPRVSVVYGQLTDFPLLESIVNEYEVRSIIHLAAQPIVQVANRNPFATFEANVRGTYNLLEAARHLGDYVQQIMVMTSDKAYGDHQELPYRETYALQGRNPYDASKSAADLIAQSYARTYDMPITVARCGNIYGPGDRHWNRIVPGTFRSIIRDEPPIIRSDGTLVRDYFFVEDTAEALLLLTEESGNEGISGEAFNFSPNQPLSVIEIVTKMLTIANRTDLTPIIKNEANHEIQEQYLSSEKARRLLGWTATTSLEAGLKKTYAWYQEYFSRG